eukprot:CAMPEP_0202873522 /NCGR_PEP_ID=MMETSP1391-20130828/23411_1 /ASSEMBLY_ACC=CAM_ASM_000867 /TAXON_ID=1034604 /ORGANISM="Chlamydomonas leiostraca, Strain SAG 11-49" /LENGTH=54 /DNA_ID=CAMNT_0049554749 /DNA_START=219 /DNA_END=380 /DNA_ORIENTATION=-
MTDLRLHTSCTSFGRVANTSGGGKAHALPCSSFQLAPSLVSKMMFTPALKAAVS